MGRHEPLNYEGARALFRRLARKTGLRKRVYSHLMRHTRATELANVLTEAQMKEYLGWVQGSDMPSVYVHLCGRDVDNALLRAHGITVTEESKPKMELTMTTCPRCRQKAGPEALGVLGAAYLCTLSNHRFFLFPQPLLDQQSVYLQSSEVFVAIVTLISSLLGVLFGHVLALRISRDIDDRRFRRRILKGIRMLKSELEDNERSLKKGDIPSKKAWIFVREEAWFFPPIVESHLENRLGNIYELLDQYDERVRDVLKANPMRLEAVLSDYRSVVDDIETVKTELNAISERLLKKI